MCCGGIIQSRFATLTWHYRIVTSIGNFDWGPVYITISFLVQIHPTSLPNGYKVATTNCVTELDCTHSWFGILAFVAWRTTFSSIRTLAIHTA